MGEEEADVNGQSEVFQKGATAQCVMPTRAAMHGSKVEVDTVLAKHYWVVFKTGVKEGERIRLSKHNVGAWREAGTVPAAGKRPAEAALGDGPTPKVAKPTNPEDESKSIFGDLSGFE